MREVLGKLFTAMRADRLALFFGAAVSRYEPSSLPLGSELKVFVIDDVLVSLKRQVRFTQPQTVRAFKLIVYPAMETGRSPSCR